ncbi:Wzt carbohydrate-binding domain-containing protein, partial [Candidatus Parcubacteria bacterium]|nr:Wzt carbohydrate-binding domain-containing protein [Candidatus Parcubacteria bacterium]
GEKVNQLINGEYYTFCFKYEATNRSKIINDLNLTMAISLENGSPITLISNNFTKQNFNQASASGLIRCKINQKLPLTEGIYNIAADLFSDGQREDFIKNLGVIEVKNGDFYGTGVNIKHSPFYLEQDWSLEKIN